MEGRETDLESASPAVSLEEAGGSPEGRVARLAGILLLVAFSLVFVVVPGAEGSAGATAKGDRLAQEHKLLSAATQYEIAVGRPGGNPMARSRLGSVLLHRGQAQDAARELSFSIAGGATDTRTMLDLASAQEKSGDLEASFLTLRQELALHPDDADAWVRLVEGAARAGLRPPEIRQRLAGALTPTAGGSLAQKIQYLQGACLLDPTTADGQNALISATSGPDASLREAASDLAADGREPDPDKRALAMANSLLGQGLLGPAAAQLGERQKDGAPEAERQALLGYVFMQTGKLEEAEAALRQSQAQDPNLQVGQLMMGTFLRARGEAEQAAPYLEKAARQKPANPAAYVEFANDLIDLGDYGDAEQSLEVAVKTSPEDGHLRLAVAEFYISRQFGLSQGIPEATEAVRLLGRTASTLGTLAWGLHLSGQSYDALGPMVEAVDKDPESALLRYRLGSIYEGLGKRAEARQQYLMVHELDGTGSVWKRAQTALKGL